MGRFDGRIAIVTGSAQGIGLGIARRLSAEGASVALLDLDGSATSVLAESMPGRAIGVECDVSEAESVDAAVEQVVADLGGVHILVNNAGITRDSMLFRMAEADWDLVLAVNLKGPFLMTRATQKYLVAQRYGKILNLSSVSALGYKGQANYSAAKMGIQGFTRTLALELGPLGVNANAIAPGFVATPMTDAAAQRLNMTPEEFQATAAKAIPVRRVGFPEDIAAAASFLCSDEASYITGQTLYVDGGGKL